MTWATTSIVWKYCLRNWFENTASGAGLKILLPKLVLKYCLRSWFEITASEASLVMSRKNIQLEWLGRGNIDDIETSWIHWKNAKIPWHCHFKFIAYRTMSPVINFYKIVICSFGDFNILCSFIDPSVYCIMLKGTSTEYYKCDV